MPEKALVPHSSSVKGYLIWGKTPYYSPFWPCSEFILDCGPSSQVARGSDKREGGSWETSVITAGLEGRLAVNLLILFPVPHTPGDSWLRERSRREKFPLISTMGRQERGGVTEG